MILTGVKCVVNHIFLTSGYKYSLNVYRALLYMGLQHDFVNSHLNLDKHRKVRIYIVMKMCMIVGFSVLLNNIQ